MEYRICDMCETVLDEDSLFCPVCGNRLERKDEPESESKLSAENGNDFSQSESYYKEESYDTVEKVYDNQEKMYSKQKERYNSTEEQYDRQNGQHLKMDDLQDKKSTEIFIQVGMDKEENENTGNSFERKPRAGSSKTEKSEKSVVFFFVGIVGAAIFLALFTCGIIAVTNQKKAQIAASEAEQNRVMEESAAYESSIAASIEESLAYESSVAASIEESKAAAKSEEAASLEASKAYESSIVASVEASMKAEAEKQSKEAEAARQSQSESLADEASKAAALENDLDVDAEVEKIRSWYYSPGPEDTNVILEKGTGRWNYSREYYYHKGQFYFAFIYDRTEEHRLYFKDGVMIQYIDENGVTYTYGNLEKFSEWEERAVEEAKKYTPD